MSGLNKPNIHRVFNPPAGIASTEDEKMRIKGTIETGCNTKALTCWTIQSKSWNIPKSIR